MYQYHQSYRGIRRDELLDCKSQFIEFIFGCVLGRGESPNNKIKLSATNRVGVIFEILLSLELNSTDIRDI